MEKGYILLTHTGSIYDSWEYYTGKSYMVQGTTYPCISHNREDAKKYSSEYTASNARRKLMLKFGRLFRVEQI